jgi:hypothetical protein
VYGVYAINKAWGSLQCVFLSSLLFSSLLFSSVLTGSAHAQALGEVDSRNADATIISADMGWSFSSTVQHLIDQETFSALVHQLQGDYPTTFADSVFANVPGGTSNIYFKGSIPSGATAAASATGLSINLVGGAPYSADEMQQQIDYAGDYLDSKGYTNYVLSFVDDTLEVTIGNGQPAPSFPGTVTATVIVELSSNPVAWFDSASGRGGMWAQTPGGSNTCTTSFTVRDVITSVTGVTTAEHCGALGTIANPFDPTDTTPVSFETEHFGVLGDFQWHSTPSRPDFAEFWSNQLGERRQVNSVARGFSRNDLTCFYGQASDQRFCTRVRRTNATLRDTSYSLTRIRYLVSTAGTLTVGGDSGGPWTVGSRAQGVHSGSGARLGGRRAFFSKPTHVENILGVEIVVQ